MESGRTRLSVNINKIATLRNARGGKIPDVIKAAADCEHFGAEGITVHPRPDERHIRREDVLKLKEVVTTEFNIEGFPSKDFLDLVEKVRPKQVTLVPDAPDVLTSNAGWDTINHLAMLREIIAELKSWDLRVSIFIDPIPKRIEAARETGTDRVELYTEAYAKQYPHDREQAVKPYVEAALEAQKIGLGINAGHDLNLDNLAFFAQKVPGLQEVSIGHALICDALYLGLENAIRMYKARLA